MLTFVPTPIGNLSDITFRALEVFAQTELFLCEDTRVTKRLLALLQERFEHFSPLPYATYLSFHEHNAEARIDDIAETLHRSRCAYVSDAGMPCISDPGQQLVAYCQEQGIDYEVLPGATALSVAYAASGFESGRFAFYAFLSSKPFLRRTQLAEIMHNGLDAIVYEAPHRLLDLLRDIADIDPKRTVFAAKELSKRYQRYYKSDAKALVETLSQESIRGEWCIVIEGKKETMPKLTLSQIERMDLPPKVKAKLLSELTGESVKSHYARLIQDH